MDFTPSEVLDSNCNSSNNDADGNTHGYTELHAQADSYAEVSADAPTAPVVSSDFRLQLGRQ